MCYVAFSPNSKMNDKEIATFPYQAKIHIHRVRMPQKFTRSIFPEDAIRLINCGALVLNENVILIGTMRDDIWKFHAFE